MTKKFHTVCSAPILMTSRILTAKNKITKKAHYTHVEIDLNSMIAVMGIVLSLLFLEVPADPTVATILEPALALQAVDTEGLVVQTMKVSSYGK